MKAFLRTMLHGSVLISLTALCHCNGTPPPADVTPTDAADVAPDIDAVTDAGPATYSAMVYVTSLVQNCGDGGNDPLAFTGRLSITNTGSVAIGPIAASTGSITMGTTDVQIFGIVPVSIPAIDGGTTGMVAITKQPGTLMPIGCDLSLCGVGAQVIRVRVPISGPNVPPGSIVSSELMVLTCM